MIEYTITLISRSPIEENPLSVETAIPTIIPPEGEGWVLKHTLLGFHKIYLFWERTA
jgi:hypothetical protein